MFSASALLYVVDALINFAVFTKGDFFIPSNRAEGLRASISLVFALALTFGDELCQQHGENWRPGGQPRLGQGGKGKLNAGQSYNQHEFCDKFSSQSPSFSLWICWGFGLSGTDWLGCDRVLQQLAQAQACRPLLQVAQITGCRFEDALNVSILLL